MKVRLIAATTPLIPEAKTAEELIVYAARVSNPSNQANMETAEKLLRYCIEHEHWSVFEQASMTVEIQTSRAISAQILRHRSFSFQEFSQRYAAVAEIEPIRLRKQAQKNRQSSTEEIGPYKLEISTPRVVEFLKTAYESLIKSGVARECARMILPMASSTTLYMTGSARSWIHYLKLRTKPDTQLEHREIAGACKNIFAEVFPTVSKAVFA